MESEFNPIWEQVAAAFSKIIPVDDETARLRIAWQQSNILRVLLRSGMSPEQIVKEFRASWSVDAIQALRQQEAHG